MVNFVMDQGRRMDETLKAMKALIVSCTELFSVMVEPSEDGKTSSSYSDLTLHDMVEIQGVAVGGGNQHVEEVDQVEDITALTIPPVSNTEVVVLIATLVSSTVGEETLVGCRKEQLRGILVIDWSYWPPKGIDVLNPWGIPFLNTLILLSFGRCNTTESYRGLPRGCPGSASACTTCSGISIGQPYVRTIGAGHCGDGGPRGSESRARWT